MLLLLLSCGAYSHYTAQQHAHKHIINETMCIIKMYNNHAFPINDSLLTCAPHWCAAKYVEVERV